MADHPVPAAAKELSPEEAQARQEQCYALHQAVVDAVQRGRTALWDLHRALYEFNEEVGWSALGYDSLKDYLADPEVGLKPSTYYHAVATWRKLVVKRGVLSDRLENLDPSKVQVVLASIEGSRVGVEEALSDVEALSKRDLQEKYYGPRDPGPIDDDLGDEARRDDADRGIPEPPVTVNDGSESPQWASDATSDATLRPEEEEPSHNPRPQGSGRVSYADEADGPILVKADFLLLYQALQGWEDPRRKNPCPRDDVRAVRLKIKKILAVLR